mmetsp:Transcript_26358/g.80013  ORF Transcript_26358/g.80013 Transcript_26358/m.80013 type:complete len:143 (+) Transcript_26358:917-1345(+)
MRGSRRCSDQSLTGMRPSRRINNERPAPVRADTARTGVDATDGPDRPSQGKRSSWLLLPGLRLMEQLPVALRPVEGVSAEAPVEAAPALHSISMVATPRLSVGSPLMHLWHEQLRGLPHLHRQADSSHESPLPSRASCVIIC